MACGVTDNSAFDQSTVVESAIEHCPGTIRTTGFEQVPVFGNSNPAGGNAQTTTLGQITAGLDPEIPEIGAVSGTMNFQTLTTGSGIANRPPAYWRYLEACGFYSTRTASIAGPAAASFAGADVGSGGAMAPGNYVWKFSVLYQSDGTTEATTEAEAAFESDLSSDNTGVVAITESGSGNADGSCNLSNLPTDGIKVIYRTEVGGTTASRTYKVGTVADGTTTFTDTRHDKDLDEAAPVTLVDPDETAFAVDDGTTVGAGNVDVGAHQYFFTDLYDRDGVVVDGIANLNNVVYMSQGSAAQTSTIASTAKAVTVTLPTDNNGLKVIWRTKVGITGIANSYRVGIADPNDGATYVDNVADASLIVPFETPVDEAIMTPAGSASDHLAVSAKIYLDGRQETIRGGRGNFSQAGSAGQTVPITFDFAGASDDGSQVENPASVTTIPTAPKLCEAGFYLRRDSAPATYITDLKLQSVNLNIGRTPAERLDGNAACSTSAVTEYSIAQRANTTLQVVIEFDKTQNWVADLKAKRLYEWQYQVGTTARSRVYVGNYVPWTDRFYTAQNQYPATSGLPNGYRGQTLNFVVGGTGNNFVRFRHR